MSYSVVIWRPRNFCLLISAFALRSHRFLPNTQTRFCLLFAFSYFRNFKVFDEIFAVYNLNVFHGNLSFRCSCPPYNQSKQRHHNHLYHGLYQVRDDFSMDGALRDLELPSIPKARDSQEEL